MPQGAVAQAPSPTQAAAPAGLDEALLALLASDDNDEKIEAIGKLARSTDPKAAALLLALGQDHVYLSPEGKLLISDDDGATGRDPLSGAAAPMPEGSDTLTINNRVRGAIDDARAIAQLHAPDPAARLAAAQQLQQAGDETLLPVLDDAIGKETDAQVRSALQTVRARLQLSASDPAARAAAARTLGETGNPAFRAMLAAVAQPRPDGSYAEPDASVRAAATQALRGIDRHMTTVEWAGNVFYGLSLGSVLLLAALGLAITFGLMGVINMAHGELIMIGAYATYTVQLVFRQYLPGWIDWYVLAALPVAFIATGLVGMALERTVIRWLYGRPLETLLATWGISLILMQAVRSLFGAQNVEVANPGWMSGGITVMDGLVLTYNRIVIVLFAFLVVFFVWLLLNHTRLGLFVRSITQNRAMADCLGVPTGRIDMLAFGLGSGIAGLAGVALSQLGNVGPALGQGYIVDSFMVVVLGGVGQLAGTVIAGLGLGWVNKFLEPYAGAVLAKITILALIVLFVQKRPQGLFAPKGRSAE
ncbi:urea ABC transporter permease subunit UrtB [Bordetella genomosp. 10]|nr:urea ABC transporter permease subunit UrtB [Bordetella genomosp. 10]